MRSQQVAQRSNPELSALDDHLPRWRTLRHDGNWHQPTAAVCGSAPVPQRMHIETELRGGLGVTLTAALGLLRVRQGRLS
jgi:hypothetical protein